MPKHFPPECFMLVSKVVLLEFKAQNRKFWILRSLNSRELILIGLSYHFSLVSIGNIIKRQKPKAYPEQKINYHSPQKDPFLYMLCDLSSPPINLAQQADCTWNRFVFIQFLIFKKMLGLICSILFASKNPFHPLCFKCACSWYYLVCGYILLLDFYI